MKDINPKVSFFCPCTKSSSKPGMFIVTVLVSFSAILFSNKNKFIFPLHFQLTNPNRLPDNWFIHYFLALGGKVECTVRIIVISLFWGDVGDHHRVTATSYGILQIKPVCKTEGNLISIRINYLANSLC